jgi:hypothetical protein
VAVRDDESTNVLTLHVGRVVSLLLKLLLAIRFAPQIELINAAAASAEATTEAASMPVVSVRSSSRLLV